MITREELIERYLEAAKVPESMTEKARENLANKKLHTLVKATVDARNENEETSLWLTPKRM